jgi:hypothetical protein
MWLRKFLYSSEDIYQTTDILIVSFSFFNSKKSLHYINQVNTSLKEDIKAEADLLEY